MFTSFLKHLSEKSWPFVVETVLQCIRFTRPSMFVCEATGAGYNEPLVIGIRGIKLAENTCLLRENDSLGKTLPAASLNQQLRVARGTPRKHVTAYATPRNTPS